MSIAELPIAIDDDRIDKFCRDRGICKLSVFGSVLRDDFDLDRSDVDILAEFDPGALKGVGLRYFRYARDLTEILGCKVDFCSRLDKYIEPSVREQAIPIYERS
jgi:predicted nucleotidyltransferase